MYSSIYDSFAILPFGFWVIVFGVVGACLGSFFNVVIWRMPRGESVMHPPSKCPKCDSGIAWYDNVPVFGWLWLCGKCRNCKNPISSEYPIVESVTGLLGLLALFMVQSWFVDPLWGDYIAAFILMMVLVPVVVIDLRHYLIPDMIVLPAAVVIWAISPFRSQMGIVDSFIGGFGIALGLWGFAAIMSFALKKQAMGFGDVKYMLFAGSLLGFRNAVLTIVIGSFTGLIIIPLLKAFNQRELSSKFPFGPMLGFGTFVALFWGDKIWALYFGLFF